MMKISIIIVTYNSLDLIKDCVDSIFKFNDLQDSQVEIIVVDNSNEEEGLALKNFLADNYQSKVIFIKNQNLGYGHGNNVGVKASTGDIIAVMNPDVRLNEPIFKRTLEHFSNDEVASLGFQQINGVSDFSFYRFPELFSPLLYSYINRKDNKSKKFDQHIHSLSGAFVFFRKSDFIQIGMYDESMFMYFEEPDVARRINYIGKKIIFDTTKGYIHLMDHKDDFNERLLDIGTESIGIYFKKHNLNHKKYIKKRIIELKMHKLIFSITSNKARVLKADAYIKSLKRYGY